MFITLAINSFYFFVSNRTNLKFFRYVDLIESLLLPLNEIKFLPENNLQKKLKQTNLFCLHLKKKQRKLI